MVKAGFNHVDATHLQILKKIQLTRLFVTLNVAFNLEKHFCQRNSHLKQDTTGECNNYNNKGWI